MNFIEKAEDRERLEKELYDIANKLVGNVGPDADADYFKSRWHAFALFCVCRKAPVYSEVVGMWAKWIKAYCDFKKLHTPEAARLMENPDLTVRWLLKPVIEVDGDYLSHVTDKIIKSVGIRVKAYLAIYRTDCEPVVQVCSRCKEMDKALRGSQPS